MWTTKHAKVVVTLSILLAGMLGVMGCRPNESISSRSDSAKAVFARGPVSAQPAATIEEEHGHVAGKHGGIIISIGKDSYHAEAVIEKSGIFRLLTLGNDESRIQEVEAQQLKAYVKAVGDTDAVAVELEAVRQDGDAEGKTSQFVGQLPANLIGNNLEVTIPNLRIEGERFRIGFTTVSSVHDSSMPAGVSGSDERDLYLTPGGLYSESDIQSNGNMTASQKFKGIKSAHDMHPKPGDRVCPITMTKANSKFAWIVNGKSYQFCCPPCVDEFVRLAKANNQELQDPDHYLQR